MPRWGLNEYRDFAKAIFQVVKFSQEQKEQLMAKFREMGHNFGYDALRQHIQALIRDDKVAAVMNASTVNNPNSGTGALQAAKPAQRPPRRTAKKRSAAVYMDSDEDEENKRPKKMVRFKEETLMNLGQMEDDKPKPRRGDQEYWTLNDDDDNYPSYFLD